MPVSILNIQTERKKPTPKPTAISKTALLICGAVFAST